MNSLEQYVSWVIQRIGHEGDLREEPDLELKSAYRKETPDSEVVWEVADLVASLANDAHLDGFRALVFGPRSDLTRPGWLSDEARLRDKLLRHFDQGVVPGVEVIRREVPDKGLIDAFIIVERSSTPYVTRLHPGGPWVVRVRTNTARRTATRAELMALAGGSGKTLKPVRKLTAHLASLGKGTRKVEVTNVGTVPIRDISLDVPEGASTAPFDNSVIELLNPGERDAIPILAPGRHWGVDNRSERVTVRGTAEDGEVVETTLLVSGFD